MLLRCCASRDRDLTGFGGLADVRQNALVQLLPPNGHGMPWHTADARMAGSGRVRASSEGLTSTRKARPSALTVSHAIQTDPSGASGASGANCNANIKDKSDKET